MAKEVKIEYAISRKEYSIDISNTQSLNTLIYSSNSSSPAQNTIAATLGQKVVDGDFVVSGSIIVVDQQNVQRGKIGIIEQ